MEATELAARSRQDLLRRNAVCEAFFEAESGRLADACHEMSRRFLAGGRLLAFGRGAAATDAQHVSVEFVHPVIVGKRALPALDLGPNFASCLPLLAHADDIVIGFAFDGPDAAVTDALQAARAQGALTFGLASDGAEHSFRLPDDDPFVCQEVFEILYHVLWETVHVFFEHREQGRDVGASAFLYPFLGRREQDAGSIVAEVQQSMRQKAAEVSRLRAAAAQTEADSIAVIAQAISQRVAGGGKIIAFGNGGSATDANDFVLDCVMPPPGWTPVPAVSLASQPADITAIANDIGVDAIFTRQLLAHARPGDTAVGFSASGSSSNVLAALAEARRQGLFTVGIAGYDGGRMADASVVDSALVIRSDYVPRIQEAQASVYHTLRARIEDVLKGG